MYVCKCVCVYIYMYIFMSPKIDAYSNFNVGSLDCPASSGHRDIPPGREVT